MIKKLALVVISGLTLSGCAYREVRRLAKQGQSDLLQIADLFEKSATLPCEKQKEVMEHASKIIRENFK